MQKIRVAVFIILIILLVACQPSVDVQLTATSTAKPTKTALPPTATVTPFPPLAEEGPYLALEVGSWNQSDIILYNQDGIGRQIVKLPENINSHVSVQNISPDGQWLAFHTGTVNIGGEIDNLPVTLNIINIDNGQIIKVADIVTEGYLQKLEKVSDQLKILYPDRYAEIDNEDWIEGRLVSHFQSYIYSLAWSPDSKSLAFAAQIDGISSDVYIYDVETGLLNRLEESLQNVLWIDWSLDGSYIVFHNSIPGNVYTGSDFYAIKFSLSTVFSPIPLESGFWHTTLEWLSPTTLLLTGTTDTAGSHNLQKLDIVTGKTTTLWDDSYSDYLVDYENQSILLNASEYAKPEKFGIYEISFLGRQKKILDGLYYVDFFLRDGDKHRFLIRGADYMGEIELKGEVVGINETKEPTYLGIFNYENIKISPDKSWLIMYDDAKLNLYDKNDELKTAFEISGIDYVLWTPDSTGLYYSSNKSLYYLDIQSGLIKLVDQCVLENCGFRLDDLNSTWLP